jgi:type II secretory pathway pseudopilin PulG
VTLVTGGTDISARESPRRFNGKDEMGDGGIKLNIRPWERETSRAFTLMEIMVMVLVVGLLAAFAVPSFRMARQKVQHLLIANNLRQIWRSVQLYYLEHGVEEVHIDDLVWYYTPDGNLVNNAEEPYTSPIKPIVGENYSLLMSVPKSDIDLQALSSNVVIWANEAFDNLPYAEGLITDNAFIVAVPRINPDGTIQWFAIRTDSKSFICFGDLRQIISEEGEEGEGEIIPSINSDIQADFSGYTYAGYLIEMRNDILAGYLDNLDEANKDKKDICIYYISNAITLINEYYNNPLTVEQINDVCAPLNGTINDWRNYSQYFNGYSLPTSGLESLYAALCDITQKPFVPFNKT